MRLRSFYFLSLLVFLEGFWLFSCGPIGPDVTARSTGDYPAITAAVALSSNTVRVDWQDRSSKEEGYRIERREAGEQGSSVGNFLLRAQVGPNTESFLDEGLVPDSTYYYRVYYYTGDEKSRYSNIAIVTTPP